jgi:hypothetical protein
MTDKELKRFSDTVKALKKKFTSSPDEARQFLIRAGIVTKAGRLRKEYR